MTSLDVFTAAHVAAFSSSRHDRAAVSVVVTLFNYGRYIVHALDSIRRQTLRDIDVIVIDDGSIDGGDRIALDWLRAHSARFGRTRLLTHVDNSGLADARNLGFTASHTPYVFVLDADNEIYPRCLQACLEAALRTQADAVYTILEVFDGERGLMGTDAWDPEQLSRGNYIDAMALVGHSAWRRVGGYRRMVAPGWEDYDFWVKCAEHGLAVAHVPEILCRYRSHGDSMLHTVTNREGTAQLLLDDMFIHHPALRAAHRRPEDPSAVPFGRHHGPALRDHLRSASEARGAGARRWLRSALRLARRTRR